jgi:hypothetical protein
MKRNPQRKITRYQMGRLIGVAWNRAVSMGVGVSTFESTGIYPLNSNRVPVHSFSISDTNECTTCMETAPRKFWHSILFRLLHTEADGIYACSIHSNISRVGVSMHVVGLLVSRCIANWRSSIELLTQHFDKISLPLSIPFQARSCNYLLGRPKKFPSTEIYFFPSMSSF